MSVLHLQLLSIIGSAFGFLVLKHNITEERNTLMRHTAHIIYPRGVATVQ